MDGNENGGHPEGDISKHRSAQRTNPVDEYFSSPLHQPPTHHPLIPNLLPSHPPSARQPPPTLTPSFEAPSYSPLPYTALNPPLTARPFPLTTPNIQPITHELTMSTATHLSLKRINRLPNEGANNIYSNNIVPGIDQANEAIIELKTDVTSNNKQPLAQTGKTR